MKRCVTCRRSLPLADFNRKRRSTDGRQNVCRDCNRERSRRYYLENREKHLRVIAARTSRAKRLAREFAGEYLLSHPCLDCGEVDIRVLDFDHRPGTRKTRNVMLLVNRDGRDWRTALLRRRLNERTEGPPHSNHAGDGPPFHRTPRLGTDPPQDCT